MSDTGTYVGGNPWKTLKSVFDLRAPEGFPRPDVDGLFKLSDIETWMTNLLSVRLAVVTEEGRRAIQASRIQASIREKEKTERINTEMVKQREILDMQAEFIAARNSYDPLTMDEFRAKYSDEQLQELRAHIRKNSDAKKANEQALAMRERKQDEARKAAMFRTFEERKEARKRRADELQADSAKGKLERQERYA